MRRRELLRLVAGASVGMPLAARAQPAKIPVVGFLSPRTIERDPDSTFGAFRRGLRDLGYVEAQNILVQLRSSGGENQRLPALAAELAALNPDVIVTHGEPAIRAVKEAAGHIPIVMSVVGDPVAAGFAHSLSRPGRNLTGLTNLATGLVAKRLELLLEAVPNPGCVAVIQDPGHQALNALAWQETIAAAQTLGAALKPVAVGSAGELESGFAEIVRQGCGALLVLASPTFVGVRQPLVEFAARHRIPASYDNRLIVEAGGLMSYGPDTADMHRRAALYVDKILKGAKAADLPIEQPTKFELVVNLKTANALGITIPPSILARADAMIE